MDAPSTFRFGRPAGPNLPPIPYKDFLVELAKLDRVSAIEGFTRLCWAGWSSEFGRNDLNVLTRALCGRLAVLASACCRDTGVAANNDQLGFEIWRYLSVEELTTVEDEFARISDELFDKAAVRTDLGGLLSSRDQARDLMARFTYARMLRRQWAPSLYRIDSIYRTWWITRQIDTTGQLHVTLSRMLSIEPERFVRTALVLLALAYETRGCFEIDNSLNSRLTERLGVTVSDLGPAFEQVD